MFRCALFLSSILCSLQALGIDHPEDEKFLEVQIGENPFAYASASRPSVFCLRPPSRPFFDMADTPTLSVTMLGAGQEVGRSCCVLQYRGRTIVCDAGVHPAHSGMASLPFIDELDWSTVDAILITQ